MTGERVGRRAILRRGGAALLAVLAAGCTGGRSGGPVEMTDDFAFAPETATVDGGATVTWENTSDIAHTVTAYEDRLPSGAEYFASGGFDSEAAARNRVNDGLVEPGGSYEHAFEVSGTYDYFCVPHEGAGMVGTVEVG